MVEDVADLGRFITAENVFIIDGAKGILRIPNKLALALKKDNE